MTRSSKRVTLPKDSKEARRVMSESKGDGHTGNQAAAVRYTEQHNDAMPDKPQDAETTNHHKRNRPLVKDTEYSCHIGKKPPRYTGNGDGNGNTAADRGEMYKNRHNDKKKTFKFNI